MPVTLGIAVVVGILAAACGGEDEKDRCEALDHYPPDIDYEKPDRYRVAGPQTEAGEHVREAANDVINNALALGGNGLDYFRSLDEVLRESAVGERISAEISTRDAEEVLSIGYYTGCHDWAVVARAILVEMGYPVVFVDSVHREFFDEGKYRGHTFLEVFDSHCAGGKGCWLLYDPTAGMVYDDYDPSVTTLSGGYLVYAKGLDPWSMGVTSNDALRVCLERFGEDFYDTGKAQFDDVDYPVENLRNGQK